ncbi:MAG TPA: hypothetical protein VK642_04785 [Burkholderiales bacterium]|nr:hypothetical protein [Burkholderiales bacterium]
MLGNAYAPTEVEASRDLREVEQALERERNDDERNVLSGKLNVLLTRAGLAHRRKLAINNDYFQKVAEKLGNRRRS